MPINKDIVTTIITAHKTLKFIQQEIESAESSDDFSKEEILNQKEKKALLDLCELKAFYPKAYEYADTLEILE